MLESRPTVEDLLVELEDQNETAEVRAHANDGVYEIVGMEYDEQQDIVFLNLGAKITGQ